eukprot:TRINITY_DN82119_c0_g1_i1.p1 TRINITY_DN82119_c0_g1~~TRINITY_DN82119_c0_g1_i1.p1  ORF type:complete len:304 (-),score=59.57 TRINITY_DN82119_c0_g1_i1:112-1023(-)
MLAATLGQQILGSPPQAGTGSDDDDDPSGFGRRRPRAESPGTCLRNSVASLQDKITSRVHGAQKLTSHLEECLERVRAEYQSMLMLLKELELERIDLQATSQWLGNQRLNWQRQHRPQGGERSERSTMGPCTPASAGALGRSFQATSTSSSTGDGHGKRQSKLMQPPEELDRRLGDEEQALAQEVMETDRMIATLSAQAAHLRDIRDGLRRRLVDQRRLLLRHGGVLETLRRDDVFAHPASSRPGSHGAKALYRGGGKLPVGRTPPRSAPGTARSGVPLAHLDFASAAAATYRETRSAPLTAR